jgi:signal transduction histidine kinase
VAEYLTILEDEIGHAEKIVSDLLGYSGAIQTDPEAVSLPPVIDQLMMRVELPSAVEHSVELADSLPAVLVDKNHLLQILENLVENSCQAMPAGGSLRITARREGDRVSIAVEDTGAGISPENQEKVFEPLFTTKARGIGLGLAISQKLAEANQGEIGFRSIPGEKTVFWVNLPLSLKVEA